MITPLPDDEWSEYVANGQAFAGEGFQGAVGGQIGKVQLFNPVGSGIRVRLRCLEPMALFAIAINTNIRRHDVALTTFAPFAGPENLLGGGAAAVAEIRNETAVGQVGSPFWLLLAAGNNRRDYPVRHLDWGHDLLEGQGVIANTTVGGFLLMGFMWAEVPL